jgi:hypothetical protein
MTGDLEEIRAKAHEAAPALWKRMEHLPPSPRGGEGRGEG